jgi:hypothetical protein
MQAMRCLRLWLFGLALSTATLAAAGDAPSIRVSPSVAVAPTVLAIRVNVAPQSENRALEIVVDSSDFYRLTCRRATTRSPLPSSVPTASAAPWRARMSK